MIVASYICNALGLLAFIAMLLVKGRKMGLILFLSIVGNVLVGAAYLLGGNGINGALSNLLGGATSIITFCFDYKQKELPKWLIALYALGFVLVNLFGGALSWFTILAIAACMCSVMAIVQKSGKAYRVWILSNCTIWCIYDCCTQNYGSLVVHIVLLAFTLTGMFIHDRNKKEETKI